MNFSREELKLFVNSGKEQIEKVNKAFFYCRDGYISVQWRKKKLQEEVVRMR